ncbi:MAG: Rne/Rng family ribonuclease [Bdellovibrionales bacterium]|nr:Rne/Rng family ribonuclease [Bdellovibrionales bacterium]
MGAEILINVRPSQTRVAYVEDGELVDLNVERRTSPTLVGSIYFGRVIRVLPGMQAAFVDIGLDRAAFLYVGDVQTEKSDRFMENRESDKLDEMVLEAGDEEEGFEEVKLEEVKVNIGDILKEGETILVQVAKDPLGTKGARITTHISLPGRHLVFMPTVTHFGISRRIEDAIERERLRRLVEKIKPNGGVIIRTAAEGVAEENLLSDLEYLGRLWIEIEKSFRSASEPGLIHSEMDVELRALRDMLNEKVEKVIVDDEGAHQRVEAFVGQFMPKYKDKVLLYKEREPLFDSYEINLEISRSLGRKIWLKSGGYIVVDEAEALVVIDVNTGRYVGKKDLEDTILKTNMEAAKEIAHQLRIRNCGGIIIVDFIDMEKVAHREKLVTFFQEVLKKDRARTTISPMSELGLIEMTRKRIRPSLVSTLCTPCPYCDGNGYIKQKVTVTNEIFTALERDSLRKGTGATTVVHCHSDIADWVYGEEQETLEFIEKRLAHSIAFKVEPNYHLEQFEIYSV